MCPMRHAAFACRRWDPCCTGQLSASLMKIYAADLLLELFRSAATTCRGLARTCTGSLGLRSPPRRTPYRIRVLCPRSQGWWSQWTASSCLLGQFTQMAPCWMGPRRCYGALGGPLLRSMLRESYVHQLMACRRHGFAPSLAPKHGQSCKRSRTRKAGLS